MNHTQENVINAELLFDMSYVNKICRNNPEAVKKMVTVFVNTIPAAIDEIKQLCTLKDYDAVKKTTHRIKPVIMYYAIVKAERVVLDIEKMAKNRIWLDELDAKIDLLKTTVNKVAEEMKKDFNIL